MDPRPTRAREVSSQDRRLRAWLGLVAEAARRQPIVVVAAAGAMLVMGLLHVGSESLSEPMEWVLQVLVVAALLLAALTIEGRQFRRLDAARLTMEQSESRFRAMAEHSQDLSFRYRLDPPGFEYASPSWEAVTGMPAERVVRDRAAVLGLVDPADLALMTSVVRQGTEPEHPVRVRVHRIDGEERIAEFRATLVRGPDGSATHSVGTARDITEQVRAETRLADGERRFRLLAEQSQDIVFEWRLGDHPAIDYLSPAFERVSGYSVEAALRGELPPDALLARDGIGALRDLTEHGTEPGRPVLVRLRRPDGEERTVELSATVVAGDEGRPVRCVGAARDVTDRVATAARLIESEARLRDIADRSRDILFRFRLRPEPAFDFLSAGVDRLFPGVSAEQLMADPGMMERTVHPEDRFLLASLLTSTAPSRDPVTVRWLDGTGEVIHVEVTLAPLLGEDGRPDAIDGVARVVTDRVRAQEALARSEERFRLLAERSRDVIFRYRVLPTPALEYLSPSIERMTGHPVNAFMSDADLAFRILEPADLPALRSAVLEGTPDGAPVCVRWHAVDGHIATAEVIAVAVRDQSGAIVATECVARDISARVATETARADPADA